MSTLTAEHKKALDDLNGKPTAGDITRLLVMAAEDARENPNGDRDFRRSVLAAVAKAENTGVLDDVDWNAVARALKRSHLPYDPGTDYRPLQHAFMRSFIRHAPGAFESYVSGLLKEPDDYHGKWLKACFANSGVLGDYKAANEKAARDLAGKLFTVFKGKADIEAGHDFMTNGVSSAASGNPHIAAARNILRQFPELAPRR